eukprot:2077748-Karenia_brevis.AAC.1
MNRTVSPKNDEVSKDRELAAVRKSSEEGITSRNEQGGVHQNGNSASSNEVQEERNIAGDTDMERIEEEEEDVHPMKAETTPKTPTAEEYRVHRLTHLPYRSWCPHC